jgi:hypothetical protein
MSDAYYLTIGLLITAFIVVANLVAFLFLPAIVAKFSKEILVKK